MEEPGNIASSAPVREPVRAAVRAAVPSPRIGRTPLIFAIVGVVIALAAAGLYLVTRVNAPARLTPEETVREFLSAVFLASDGQRVGAVVCASWDPSDAIARTAKEIGAGIHVSWDEVSVVSTNGDRISAKARLGLRRPDDIQPSQYVMWRFSIVDENGWRVCEARPFT